LNLRRNPKRSKVKRPKMMVMVREIGTILLRGTNCHRQIRQWIGKKDESSKKISCFLCNGPHWIFELLKCGKPAALVMEQEKEKKIPSMPPLSALQKKVEGQPIKLMYVETEVIGKKVQPTMDTEPDTMYCWK